MAGNGVIAREAKWGERMIEVKVRFWTNGIAESESQVLPKHAWGSGMIRIERNKYHGITPEQPEPFNSLLELPAVIERVLIQHGIVIRLSRRMQKYVQAEKIEPAPVLT